MVTAPRYVIDEHGNHVGVVIQIEEYRWAGVDAGTEGEQPPICAGDVEALEVRIR